MPHQLEIKCFLVLHTSERVLYPDSGISMDEEIVLGGMMWAYNKAEL